MHDLVRAIAARRTIKDYSGEAVPRERLLALVEAATWAPNHRLTQPWRFYVAERARIAELVAAVQRPPIAAAVDDAKRPAICQRLAACGAVILVTCLRAADPVQQREDRDAVAAAVQNLLLAAHAAGLGAYWSTNPLLTHPETLRWFGADPAREDHVASVWLGVPTASPPPPRRRPLAEVVRWV
ncbi:MAG: nitroreductase family protein [Planctomycetota bacterium]|nr:nitroreductase family protein [Planctomycetota bacterium]MDW8373645.1 nitroreductase family protein [Planctomycetota bacterium]